MKSPCQIIIAALALSFAGPINAAPGDYFAIRVVDETTGRGVPLIELETVNNVKFFTDSNGLIAFNEPGMMDREVFFHVRGHGYEYPKDGFGFRGVRLHARAGESATIKVKRINIAERIYRITGQGIYRDSVLLGEKTPLTRPVLNGQVLGQDSIQFTIYRDRIHWFWGDTNRLSYPLGQFAMSGATSALPGKGGLDPSLGVDLTYFVDEMGFSRKMCPVKEAGLMWLEGMFVVPDEAGRQRMVCRYTRMKDLGTMLEHGIAVWNDQQEVFELHTQFDLADKNRCPHAHPIAMKDAGAEWFYFPSPFVNIRVRANLKAVVDQNAYEVFTPLAPGSKYAKDKSKIDRDPAGKIVYGWKTNTSAISQRQERELISAGLIKADEARFQMRDVDTGKPVDVHGGSVYFNEHLKRWIMVFVQSGGTSFLGEVWLAEAPAPTGPWTFAKKIVTHEKQTFYNPAHHPFFDQQSGRLIYFQGTYCNTFSGNPIQSPRYDYNQIMYRLDLGDDRLDGLHRACDTGKR